jgi:hypothetical protein
MLSFGAKQWLRWLGEDDEYPRAQGAQRMERAMTMHADCGTATHAAACLAPAAA